MKPLDEALSVSCQTEVSSWYFISKEEHGKLKEDYEKMKKEHEKLQLKCAQLQDDNFKRVREKKEMQMHATFDEDSFRDDDEKVRFFIGLTNWDILSINYSNLLRHAYLVGHPSLTPFQQLMLTLMRLRLAGSGIELGYQFGIHPSTVSCIFSGVI